MPSQTEQMPGTQHEVKAFSEFMETHRMKFRFLGAAVYYGLHSAFERIE